MLMDLWRSKKTEADVKSPTTKQPAKPSETQKIIESLMEDPPARSPPMSSIPQPSRAAPVPARPLERPMDLLELSKQPVGSGVSQEIDFPEGGRNESF